MVLRATPAIFRSRWLCRSPIKSNLRLSSSSAPTEHKVVMDGGTLYIGKDLAEALGWKPEQGVDRLPLSLHGWSPHYFTITQAGTDNELLARGTIESSRNTNVQKVLDYLKDR